MAASIATKARKKRIEQKIALEFGAITDQPHDAKPRAKPTRARPSLNRSFVSIAKGLAA
jgi:hypothetical protein